MRCWGVLLALGMNASSYVTPGEPAGDDATPRPQAAVVDAGFHWYAFAVPFYLPETSFGLGTEGGVHRVICQGCQPSSLALELAYTLKDQLSVTLTSHLFTAPSFTVAASLHYALFPDHFYGLGPNSPDEGEEFTPRSYELSITPEWYVIGGRLRIGPKLHLRKEEIVAREPGRLLASGAIAGGSGSSEVGLGASATLDSRDSQFFPRRGSYLEVWYLYYPGPLGHHSGFGRGAVDAERFLALGNDHILALEGSLAFTQGDAPFTQLAGLGGVHGIRGYADGRYLDKISFGLQAEWRFPIVGRLRGVLFGGAGEVAPTPGGVNCSSLRAAAGAGLRLRLTGDGVYARVDLATAGGAPDVYLTVLEAF